MSLPLVNIIIVTYNQYHFTEACVRSLLVSSYRPIKIFLVDNGSAPGIYQGFYNKYSDHPLFEFIRSEKNLGFGGGCNLALKRIKEGFVVFLNSDTEVTPDWLSPLVAYMEAHPDVGACQPKIRDLQRRDYFEYAGAAGGFMDVYGYPFTRGRIFFTLEKDEGQYDTIIDLVWCSGVAFVTRKEIIDQVGLFDEIFFMYGEEADLCWRINHAGYRLVFIPHSIVYHYGAGTMRVSPKCQKVFYSHRNGLILMLKNYMVREWIRFLAIRILFDLLAFFYYIVNRPWHLNWLAVPMAYAHILLLSPRILFRHFQIRSFRLRAYPRLIHAPLYQRSILFDYFFSGKKKFSDLRRTDFLS